MSPPNSARTSNSVQGTDASNNNEQFSVVHLTPLTKPSPYLNLRTNNKNNKVILKPIKRSRNYAEIANTSFSVEKLPPATPPTPNEPKRMASDASNLSQRNSEHLPKLKLRESKENNVAKKEPHREVVSNEKPHREKVVSNEKPHRERVVANEETHKEKVILNGKRHAGENVTNNKELHKKKVVQDERPEYTEFKNQDDFRSVVFSISCF